MARSRLRRVAVVAAALFLVAAVGLVGLTLSIAAVEYRYHRQEREDLYGYVNIEGYRGQRLNHKRAGEFRAVVVGGSTTYGQGVNAIETIPAALERKLRGRGRDISVANLGYMNDGVYADGLTLRDYRYLHYDLAILYEGYNDLFNVPNLYSFRHRSVVFRLTGYFPMFPLVLAEKAKSLRYHGDLNAAYRGDQPVVPIGLPSRAGAAALEFAASLDSRMNAAMQEAERTTEGACGYWTFFCEHVAANVQTALDAGADVLFVVQPYLPSPDDRPDDSSWASLHRGQSERVLSYLQQRFGGDVRLHVANIGEAIDLRKETYRLDNVHLTATGNEVVAEHLVDPVMAIASQHAAARSSAVLH